MAQKSWYIHLLGETLGPLPEKTIALFLKQGRLNFVDFAWSEGLPHWTRLYETVTFAELMPAPPEVAPPRGKDAAPLVSQTVTQTSAPKSRRAAIQGRVKFTSGEIAHVSDLTERSVFIKAGNLKSSREIEFFLELHSLEESLKLTGIVVGRSEDGSTEIEFTRLNPAYRRLIQSYVQNSKNSSRAA